MSTRDTGGPAFPMPEVRNPDGGVVKWGEDGMTLRDYFAAKAMAGFNKSMVDYGWDAEILEAHAIDAYRIADAMLRERAK